MKPLAILFHIILFTLPGLCLNAVTYSSGSPHIDEMREEVKTSATTPDNYLERILLLLNWMGILQQYGADLHPCFEVDQTYFALESRYARSDETEKPAIVREMCKAVDAYYVKMEQVFRTLKEEGPMFEPFTADPADFPKGGDMSADWPMFQGNKHNTGYTTAPGPKTGELAWKFPIGLGWYAAPAVEGNRVYVTSPGMYATSFCLDLETGNEIWRSTQTHPITGVYKYPSMASTPEILEDRIILREINSHGGNEGQARNLVYIDKKTGKTLSRKYAGHLDYRVRVAPVATNGKYTVYPFGVQDIYSNPAICQNLNRLICADVNNDRKLWEFNIGDIDALAEPVMTDTHVFQGTTDGYLYSVNLNPRAENRVAWEFHADGAVNTSVTLNEGRVYFGSNGGGLYSLNESDGSLLWETHLQSIEPGANKQFTVPLLEKGKLYVGCANQKVYCLDADTGEILWSTKLTDWVRSKPAMTSQGLVVATVDGKMTCLGRDGSLRWQKQISTHPIYADLVSTGDSVLVNDSDYWTRRVSANGDVLWKHSFLESYTDDKGDRIFTDFLAGGTYYQSKPTASNGKVYFGNPAGFLYCADADTGEELWKFEMGAAISVGPAIADGRVFAGQQGGERFFYCLDADSGELLWKQALPGGWVWGSAAVDEGRVYVPLVSGYAACLDAETGNILWLFPTPRSLPAEPAIDGDLVYFGAWGHLLYAFDKVTGEVVWKKTGFSLDSGTLIAYDNKIYIPDGRRIFKSFDGKTGEILNDGKENAEAYGGFRNFNATPAFFKNRAYYTARAGYGMGGIPMATRVYSVDPATAEIHWTFPDGGGLSAPAIASDRVYIASGSTNLFYCLDAFTGEPLWIYKFGLRVEESTLCIYRDKVYALSADGYVHAIK